MGQLPRLRSVHDHRRPADANASDLIALNDTSYATTIHACGGVADGVWALDLSRETGGIRNWTTAGGSPTGAPAFGTDGTLFVAVGPKTGATRGGDALWPGLGQIHVATYDSTVYAFGFPVERY